MENIAVNNLATISEQSLYQHGWLTPRHKDKRPLDEEKPAEHKSTW